MSSDQTAQLIYLVLLLAAVAGWFLVTGRRNLDKTLQQALIWLFIFAGAVLLYGLRDTLDRAIFVDAPQRTDTGALVISRSSDAHFYGIGHVNGVPIRFLFDTGATGITLSQADARKIGIDPETLVFDGQSSTANGTVNYARIRLDRLEVAGHVQRNVRAAVNGGELDVSLLGMSYLSRFSRVTIEGDRMILSP